MGNIEFFNELAAKGLKSNARMISLNFGVYRKTFVDIDRKLKFGSADVVLDLGGGTGQLAGLVALKSGNVVLADGAEEALNIARRDLKERENIEYQRLDLTKFPLPFADNFFDKIICYSVVHYLSDHKQFLNLVKELLRITKSHGKILIGDIPLSDKGRDYLDKRKENPFQDFLGSAKYFFKKNSTNLLYKLKDINSTQVHGLSYDRKTLEHLLSQIKLARFAIVPQDSTLPFANSREDVIISKP